MGRKHKNMLEQRKQLSQESSDNDVSDVMAIYAFMDQGSSVTKQVKSESMDNKGMLILDDTNYHD